MTTKTNKSTKTTRTTLAPTARITILAAGRENPRRAKTGAHRRYATLLKSGTVGAFLAKHPGWASTVARAAREKLVRVA